MSDYPGGSRSPLPLAFLLSSRTSLTYEGIWWSFPISEIVAATVAVLWFRTGRWRGRTPPMGEQRLEDRVIEEAIVEEGLER